MRELADDILVMPNEKDLETLNSFFEVAKTQNWVSPFDILAIKKDYDSLREELRLINSKNPQIFSDPNSSEAMPRTINNEEIMAARTFGAQSIERNERQEMILAFLREKGRAQVWEIKQLFPEVTKRTLRRDFEQMLEQGLVERIGEKNNTFYQVKTLNA